MHACLAQCLPHKEAHDLHTLDCLHQNCFRRNRGPGQPFVLALPLQPPAIHPRLSLRPFCHLTTGFDFCRNLRELNLEDNCIATLNGIAPLASLTKLEIGANRLTGLTPLTVLTGLCHLSIESNGIDTLAGVESLTSLLELYASNNGVSDMKDVQRLRALPRCGGCAAGTGGAGWVEG